MMAFRRVTLTIDLQDYQDQLDSVGKDIEPTETPWLFQGFLNVPLLIIDLEEGGDDAPTEG